jgi:hypothetical protein
MSKKKTDSNLLGLGDFLIIFKRRKLGEGEIVLINFATKRFYTKRIILLTNLVSFVVQNYSLDTCTPGCLRASLSSLQDNDCSFSNLFLALVTRALHCRDY